MSKLIDIELRKSNDDDIPNEIIFSFDNNYHAGVRVSRKMTIAEVARALYELADLMTRKANE